MPAKASAIARNKKSGNGAVLGRKDTEHTNSSIYCQTSTSLAQCIMDLLDEMIREKMWSTSIPEMDWNLGNASAYIEKARNYAGEVAMNDACLLGLALAHIEEAFRRDTSSDVCRYVIQHHSTLFGTYRLRQAIATQYATIDSTRSTQIMALTMQTWDMEKLVYISALGSYPGMLQVYGTMLAQALSCVRVSLTVVISFNYREALSERVQQDRSC